MLASFISDAVSTVREMGQRHRSLSSNPDKPPTAAENEQQRNDVVTANDLLAQLCSLLTLEEGLDELQRAGHWTPEEVDAASKPFIHMPTGAPPNVPANDPSGDGVKSSRKRGRSSLRKDAPISNKERDAAAQPPPPTPFLSPTECDQVCDTEEYLQHEGLLCRHVWEFLWHALEVFGFVGYAYDLQTLTARGNNVILKMLLTREPPTTFSLLRDDPRTRALRQVAGPFSTASSHADQAALLNVYDERTTTAMHLALPFGVCALHYRRCFEGLPKPLQQIKKYHLSETPPYEDDGRRARHNQHVKRVELLMGMLARHTSETYLSSLELLCRAVTCLCTADCVNFSVGYHVVGAIVCQLSENLPNFVNEVVVPVVMAEKKEKQRLLRRVVAASGQMKNAKKRPTKTRGATAGCGKSKNAAALHTDPSPSTAKELESISSTRLRRALSAAIEEALLMTRALVFPSQHPAFAMTSIALFPFLEMTLRHLSFDPPIYRRSATTRANSDDEAAAEDSESSGEGGGTAPTYMDFARAKVVSDDIDGSYRQGGGGVVFARAFADAAVTCLRCVLANNPAHAECAPHFDAVFGQIVVSDLFIEGVNGEAACFYGSLINGLSPEYPSYPGNRDAAKSMWLPRFICDILLRAETHLATPERKWTRFNFVDVIHRLLSFASVELTEAVIGVTVDSNGSALPSSTATPSGQPATARLDLAVSYSRHEALTLAAILSSNMLGTLASRRSIVARDVWRHSLCPVAIPRIPTVGIYHPDEMRPEIGDTMVTLLSPYYDSDTELVPEVLRLLHLILAATAAPQCGWHVEDEVPWSTQKSPATPREATATASVSGPPSPPHRGSTNRGGIHPSLVVPTWRDNDALFPEQPAESDTGLTNRSSHSSPHPPSRSISGANSTKAMIDLNPFASGRRHRDAHRPHRRADSGTTTERPLGITRDADRDRHDDHHDGDDDDDDDDGDDDLYRTPALDFSATGYFAESRRHLVDDQDRECQAASISDPAMLALEMISLWLPSGCLAIVTPAKRSIERVPLPSPMSPNIHTNRRRVAAYDVLRQMSEPMRDNCILIDSFMSALSAIKQRDTARLLQCHHIDGHILRQEALLAMTSIRTSKRILGDLWSPPQDDGPSREADGADDGEDDDDDDDVDTQVLHRLIERNQPARRHNGTATEVPAGTTASAGASETGGGPPTGVPPTEPPPEDTPRQRRLRDLLTFNRLHLGVMLTETRSVPAHLHLSPADSFRTPMLEEDLPSAGAAPVASIGPQLDGDDDDDDDEDDVARTTTSWRPVDVFFLLEEALLMANALLVHAATPRDKKKSASSSGSDGVRAASRLVHELTATFVTCVALRSGDPHIAQLGRSFRGIQQSVVDRQIQLTNGPRGPSGVPSAMVGENLRDLTASSSTLAQVWPLPETLRVRLGAMSISDVIGRRAAPRSMILRRSNVQLANLSIIPACPEASWLAQRSWPTLVLSYARLAWVLDVATRTMTLSCPKEPKVEGRPMKMLELWLYCDVDPRVVVCEDAQNVKGKPKSSSPKHKPSRSALADDVAAAPAAPSPSKATTTNLPLSFEWLCANASSPQSPFCLATLEAVSDFFVALGCNPVPVNHADHRAALRRELDLVEHLWWHNNSGASVPRTKATKRPSSAKEKAVAKKTMPPAAVSGSEAKALLVAHQWAGAGRLHDNLPYVKSPSVVTTSRLMWSIFRLYALECFKRLTKAQSPRQPPRNSAIAVAHVVLTAFRETTRHLAFPAIAKAQRAVLFREHQSLDDPSQPPAASTGISSPAWSRLSLAAFSIGSQSLPQWLAMRLESTFTETTAGASSVGQQGSNGNNHNNSEELREALTDHAGRILQKLLLFACSVAAWFTDPSRPVAGKLFRLADLTCASTAQPAPTQTTPTDVPTVTPQHDAAVALPTPTAIDRKRARSPPKPVDASGSAAGQPSALRPPVLSATSPPIKDDRGDRPLPVEAAARLLLATAAERNSRTSGLDTFLVTVSFRPTSPTRGSRRKETAVPVGQDHQPPPSDPFKCPRCLAPLKCQSLRSIQCEACGGVCRRGLAWGCRPCDFDLCSECLGAQLSGVNEHRTAGTTTLAASHVVDDTFQVQMDVRHPVQAYHAAIDAAYNRIVLADAGGVRSPTDTTPQCTGAPPVWRLRYPDFELVSESALVGSVFSKASTMVDTTASAGGLFQSCDAVAQRRPVCLWLDNSAATRCNNGPPHHEAMIEELLLFGDRTLEFTPRSVNDAQRPAAAAEVVFRHLKARGEAPVVGAMASPSARRDERLCVGGATAKDVSDEPPPCTSTSALITACLGFSTGVAACGLRSLTRAFRLSILPFDGSAAANATAVGDGRGDAVGDDEEVDASPAGHVVAAAAATAAPEVLPLDDAVVSFANAYGRLFATLGVVGMPRHLYAAVSQCRDVGFTLPFAVGGRPHVSLRTRNDLLRLTGPNGYRALSASLVHERLLDVSSSLGFDVAPLMMASRGTGVTSVLVHVRRDGDDPIRILREVLLTRVRSWPSNFKLDVRFAHEAGVGDGPTQDFYAQVSEVFARDEDQLLWSEPGGEQPLQDFDDGFPLNSPVEDGAPHGRNDSAFVRRRAYLQGRGRYGILFPRWSFDGDQRRLQTVPTPPLATIESYAQRGALRSAEYELIGRVFGRARVDGHVLPLSLHPVVWELMLLPYRARAAVGLQLAAEEGMVITTEAASAHRGGSDGDTVLLRNAMHAAWVQFVIRHASYVAFTNEDSRNGENARGEEAMSAAVTAMLGSTHCSVSESIVRILDPEFAKQIASLRNIPEPELIELELSVLGVGDERGIDRPVCDASSRDTYIEQRFTERALHVWRGAQSIGRGLHSVIPLDGIALLLNADECNLIFSGHVGRGMGSDSIPIFSSADEIYAALVAEHGYSRSSPTIRMFVDVLLSMEPRDQGHFVEFLTGSPVLPLEGLSGLRRPITVVRKDFEPGAGEKTLPSCNACFYYLKLPEYTQIDVMRERLLYAIREGRKHFAMS